ncbi:MAG: Blue-light-activated protein [Syntrophus sp. PtaB.Bin001]|nr:MAG: Blue-light-activated protein [Syntrophus sp. PtaB.Bin001]
MTDLSGTSIDPIEEIPALRQRIKVLEQFEKELKQVKEELQWKTALLDAQLDASADGMLAVSADRKKIIANQRFIELSRIPQSVLDDENNTTMLNYVAGLVKNTEEFYKSILNIFDSPLLVIHDEVEFKNGTVLERYSAPILGKDGTYHGRLATFRDITEQKQAKEALIAKNQQLMDIVEFLPDATIVIDSNDRIIAWNRAQEEMTGIKKEAMIGKDSHEATIAFYGEKRRHLLDLLNADDEELKSKYQNVHRKGNTLYAETFTPFLNEGKGAHVLATAALLFDAQGNRTGSIESIRDISERIKLEERLSRAEKMEGLGRLAGGVAHDLNNVLGILVGYSEMLVDMTPENSPMKKYANNILRAGIRGAAIIQDLLTLARRGVPVSEVVNLNKVVADYLKTPEFEKLKFYHPDVKIVADLDPGLLNIKGSSIHLEKTVMNLVSNAAEAIAGFGEVRISTGNKYLDLPIEGYDAMQEGDYAVLSISDTGGGISEDDLGKIFEPFYTKKVMGRSGTGLGLTVVWGTVKDHKGYIDVRSKAGEGTTFNLYFPVTRVQEMEDEKEPVQLESYLGRGESILVIDDVPAQRELALSILNRLGYHADAVPGGEAALVYLQSNKVDLLVLDMIMNPGIDGLETYRRVLEINPAQKAIIVSGFSQTGRVKKAQELGAGAYVRKPYIAESLGLAVRNELDR